MKTNIFCRPASLPGRKLTAQEPSTSSEGPPALRSRFRSSLLLIDSFLFCFLFLLSGCHSENRFDLLVRGGTVLTMDSEYTVYEPGYVAISGDSIVAVGPLPAETDLSADKTIEATGKIVLPGLINGHQHAPMVFMRGLADDLGLMQWLENYIFPVEAENVDEDFVYWGTLVSAVEMVRSGTTTYADMYYFENEVAEATVRVGMRGVLGETIVDFPAPDHPTVAAALKYTREFIEKWKNHPLIVPAVAPHSPYTCSQETLLAAKRLADEQNVPLMIHLAESREEVAKIKEQTGFTPILYLEQIGFLCDRLVAAHVIWPQDGEISLLKRFGVGVIHNPESNMKLAAGIAPIKAMLEAGVDVGLGTDSPATNNNWDMLQEMDSMAKLQKLSQEDPTAMSARQALAIATRGSAKALGLEQMLGSLEVGKKADLAILGKVTGSGAPMYDWYSTVVYSLSGDAVETVIVAGNVIMENRRFPHLDMEEIGRQGEAFKSKILKSLEGELQNKRILGN